MATLRVKAGEDAYGFELDDTALGTYKQFQSQYMSILVRRATRWNSSGFAKKSDLHKSGKLKRFIRKGVPHELRHSVWMHISGAYERKQRDPAAYKTALQRAVADLNVGDFAEVANSIKLDIMRTFPNNARFRKLLPADGAENREYDLEEQIASNRNLVQLRNILLAFAWRNRSVGYCQGMSCVAALLLVVTDSNEEDAFWLLEALIMQILPTDFYTANMIGLRAEIELISMLISRFFPELANVFKQFGLSLDIVIVKWFVCVFVDVLPTDTALRVLDCLFYEGSYILALVTLTLVDISRNDVFVASHSGIPAFVEVFTRMVQAKNTWDCHEFMLRAFALKKRLKLNRRNKQLDLAALRQDAIQKIREEDNRRSERRNNLHRS